MNTENTTTEPQTAAPTLPTVHQAVARAAGLSKVAGLDARNDYDKYDYRSIRAVMDSAHGALSQAGVVIVLHEMQGLARTTVKNTKGGDEILVVFTGVFRIYGPAGDHFDMVHLCEGLDRRDKAANKASSAGYKEIIQKLLTLPFGHEEAETASEAKDGAAAAPPERLPPTQKVDEYQRLGLHVYTRDENFLAWDGTQRVYREVAADKLLLEDLRKAEEQVRKRLEHLQARQEKRRDVEKSVISVQRDLRVVTDWLARRSAETETPPAEEPTPPAEPDTQAAGTADDYAASLPPAEHKPEQGAASKWPEIALVAPHVDMEADPAEIRTVAITPAEVEQLAWLEPSECAAMALELRNAALFDPALGEAFRNANSAGAEPLTGHWMATAWLLVHEATALKPKARKLLRLAIKTYGLPARRITGATHAIEKRPKSNLEHEALLKLLGAIVGPQALAAWLAKHQPPAGQKVLI